VLVVVRESVAAPPRRVAATACRNAEIAARADQQHQWVMEADERRVYGDYPPHERSGMG
jgi:hypothetical protein